jgi:hypothetical protein
MDDVRRRSKRYDEDFVAWLYEQARIVREGEFGALDRENVAEELEGLARRDRQEIRSRLIVLLLHLLKKQVQPERATGSWERTIVEQRDQIAYLIEQSPSLRRELPELVAGAYGSARRSAAAETRRVIKNFPENLPFSDKEIFGDDLQRVLPKKTATRP